MADDAILLADFGDAPSLAALAMEPEPSRVVLWPAHRGPVAQTAIDLAIGQHARAYEARVLTDPIVASHRDAAADDSPLAESIMLVRAVELASLHGIARVIWPQQVGADADRLSAAVQRVQLVTALAAIDGVPRPPAIDLPVVDLTDIEIADILEDTGAPLRAFWPCVEVVEAGGGTESGGGDDPHPCGRCAGCQRWMAAFREARVVWPWVEQVVA